MVTKIKQRGSQPNNNITRLVNYRRINSASVHRNIPGVPGYTIADSGALRHSIIFSQKFPVIKLLANQNRVIICLRHHVSA